MERARFSPQTGESADHAIERVQDEWVFHRVRNTAHFACLSPFF
jgi:hypothetical protein